MIEELNVKSKAVPQIRELALAVAHRKQGRAEPKKSPLAPLLEKLAFKR